MVRTILKNVGVIDCSQFPIGTKQIRKFVINQEDTQSLSGLANTEKAEQNLNSKPLLNSGEPHIDVYKDRYGFNITEKMKLIIAISSDCLKTKWRLQIGDKQHHLMDSGVEGLRTDDERYRLIIALKKSHLVTNAEEIVKSVGSKLEEIKETEAKSSMPTLSIEEGRKEQQKTLRKLNFSLPEDHYISKHVRYISALTDAPKEYHVLGGLWLLSAIAQGKFYLELKQSVIETNIWAILLGLSTTTHKTTSIEQTQAIWEAVSGDRLYADLYSHEGYLEKLAKKPIQHFIRDECAALFSKMKQKQNDGYFQTECSIYDCKDVKKTLTAVKKGLPPSEIIVEHPYVAKLYGTTPDKFARTLGWDEFSSGYGIRNIFCNPQYEREYMDIMLKDPTDTKNWGEVVIHAKVLYAIVKDVKGRKAFSITDEALKYYNQVLRTMIKKVREMNNDIVASAWGRSQVHILKVAMLLELGKPMQFSTISTVIDLETMKIACDWVVNYFFPEIIEITNNLQEDVRFNQIEKVTVTLKRFGGISDHSTLLRYSKIKAREFTECINTLVESKSIEMFIDKDSGNKCYRLLNTT